MCGRFTLHLGADELAREFGLVFSGLHIEKRYNIAPGQLVIVVRPAKGARALEAMEWGLVPAWSKDPKAGPRPINARAETLAEKPMFRGPFKTGRCLIPASGFYEWKAEGKARTSWYIRPKDGPLFAFAGLASLWEGPEGELRTCTIVTTSPNALMAALHDRMPAILPREHWEAWLDPSQRDPARLAELLRPCPAETMAAHPVGPAVGNPRNDAPALIDPV